MSTTHDEVLVGERDVYMTELLATKPGAQSACTDIYIYKLLERKKSKESYRWQSRMEWEGECVRCFIAHEGEVGVED